MAGTRVSGAARRIELADLAATAALAARLAGAARPGDVLALSGVLGAGKTEFARAFIRAAARNAGQEAGEVPSPTFTLVQGYDFGGAPIFHFDLYRLTAPEDAFELGIEDAFAGGVSLIEWPDRLADFLPPERLDILLAPGASPDARLAEITPHGRWADRLEALLGDGDG
jgi:tRNA threonylcarbamoyladenosine biosynthesis protein TsaE